MLTTSVPVPPAESKQPVSADDGKRPTPARGGVEEAAGDRLVREIHFLDRAARPDRNLLIVQELETASGERYFRNRYQAWKGL